MHKNFWPLVVLLGLFLFFGWPRQEVPQTSEVEIAPKSRPVKIQAQEEARPKAKPVQKSGLITAKDLNVLRSSYPHTEDVKLEVRENPHVTPPSLMKFAEKLGQLVDKGMKNPEDAKLVVNELKGCVADESVIVSSRTVCLNKAEELSRAHPQLKNDVQKVRDSAGDDVIELSRKMDSYVKKSAL